MNTVNYYEVLNVSPKASLKAIKSAYRKLSKIYHPDTGYKDQSKFLLINEAYDVLSDPDKRKEYDGTLGPMNSASRTSTKTSTKSSSRTSSRTSRQNYERSSDMYETRPPYIFKENVSPYSKLYIRFILVQIIAFIIGIMFLVSYSDSVEYSYNEPDTDSSYESESTSPYSERMRSQYEAELLEQQKYQQEYQTIKEHTKNSTIVVEEP